MKGRVQKSNSSYLKTTDEDWTYLLDNNSLLEENLLSSAIFPLWSDEMDLRVSQESLSLSHPQAPVVKHPDPDASSVASRSTPIEKESEINKSSATVDHENEFLPTIHARPASKRKRAEYEDSRNLSTAKKRSKLDPDLQQRMDNLPAELSDSQRKKEIKKIKNTQYARTSRKNDKEKYEKKYEEIHETKWVEILRRIEMAEEEHLEIKSCLNKMKNESDELNEKFEELKTRVYANPISPTMFKTQSDLNPNAKPFNQLVVKR